MIYANDVSVSKEGNLTTLEFWDKTEIMSGGEVSETRKYPVACVQVPPLVARELTDDLCALAEIEAQGRVLIPEDN